MILTEGAFKTWGDDLAETEFGAQWNIFNNPNTGMQIKIQDAIADTFLQETLLHPANNDGVATRSLNGDDISDALAARVGGIGVSPGENLTDAAAMFEMTHGTTPALAGKNMTNPSSFILSAEMLLRHPGWFEATDLIVTGFSGAISPSHVTSDLAETVGVDALSCSNYAAAVIQNM